jgi:hypothetical protein
MCRNDEGVSRLCYGVRVLVLSAGVLVLTSAVLNTPDDDTSLVTLCGYAIFVLAGEWLSPDEW